MSNFPDALQSMASWRTLIGAAGVVAACTAAATPIAPGTSRLFRDTNNGALLIAGMNPSANPSLAGTLVAEAVRPFDITVTTEFASGAPATLTTGSGTLHDWVVRRADTGTLDFYTSVHMDAPFSFAGSVTRPWDIAGQGAVEAGFRDDLVAGGNAPTRLGVGAAGTSVWMQYFATDDGVPNFITNPEGSAPVLFRSTMTRYTVGSGSVDYLYATDPSASSGSTALAFFMPGAVPEPSAAWLSLAGLLVLACRRREANAPSSARPARTS